MGTGSGRGSVAIASPASPGGQVRTGSRSHGHGLRADSTASVAPDSCPSHLFASVPSAGRTAIAALILVLAVWILVKVVVGIVAVLFVPIVLVLAVVGIIWAYRVLF